MPLANVQTDTELKAVQCPICKYNQQGTLSDLCPECGSVVDASIVCDQRYTDCLHSMKQLCYAGVAGWLVLGFAYWLIAMLPLVMARTYGFRMPTIEEQIGAWMRPMIVLAPISLLFGWSRSMQIQIYRRALQHDDKRPFVPIRVQLVGFPAIIFGSLFLIIFLGAVFT
jgi:hypothetical protein